MIEPCPLLNMDYWDFSIPSKSLVWDTGIPDECRPCLQYAQQLPKETHISEITNGCSDVSAQEIQGVDGWRALGLVLIPNSSQRQLIEETGYEFDLGETTSGLDSRITTIFACQKSS